MQLYAITMRMLYGFWDYCQKSVKRTCPSQIGQACFLRRLRKNKKDDYAHSYTPYERKQGKATKKPLIQGHVDAVCKTA